MRWQAHRGVLNPLDASPPGSVWWRAVNERLLRDGCEAVALVGGVAGEPSSQAVRLWLEFIARPTGRNWYRAHNASIVVAYLEHRDLAEAESAPERFFMNVALVRVLYAHALVGAPRLALGPTRVALPAHATGRAGSRTRHQGPVKPGERSARRAIENASGRSTVRPTARRMRSHAFVLAECDPVPPSTDEEPPLKRPGASSGAVSLTLKNSLQNWPSGPQGSSFKPS